MELRDFEVFGEPGAMVYLADCVDLMKIMLPASVDMIFADPPYRVSNGGVTVKNVRQAPVDKGTWDRSMGFEADHRASTSVGYGRSAVFSNPTEPSGSRARTTSSSASASHSRA